MIMAATPSEKEQNNRRHTSRTIKLIIVDTLKEEKKVVAFSSLAGILGECSAIHSPPALFFKNGD